MFVSKKIKFISVIASILLLFSAVKVDAQEAKIGKIKIEGAYTRSTVAGQKSAAGFMKLIDQGSSDQLIGASSTIAEDVQLHTMSMEGDVMRMRQVNNIDLPANSQIEFKPGGLHLMFVGIKSPLVAGSEIKVKLKFAKAGEVDVNFPVTASSGQTSMSHDHMKMK